MLGGSRSARGIAAFVLFISGCLGFGDLMGGSDDDAGASATDASIGDTSIAPDDSGTGDGGLVDAAIGFCAQHASATFCADFDESDAAQYGFTGVQVTDGGFLSVDHLLSTSPPGSLHAGSGALKSGDQAFGDVQRVTDITPSTSVTLDFDLMADLPPPASSPIESLAIIFSSATRSSLQLNLTATSAVLGEEIVQLDGGKEFLPHLLASSIAASWTHVTISIDTSARTVSVTVGGATSLMASTFDPGFTFGPVAINLGNAYSPGPSTGCSVHFDNLVVIVK